MVLESETLQFDYYPRRFLCIEIDYLLVGENATDEQKRFQAGAVAFAIKNSEFPYNVLVDSGSKSIHAYVRLDGTEEEINGFRKTSIDHLCEVFSMVFGNFDEGVAKQTGRVRLVRTPGAVRSNGKMQRILEVDPTPVTVDDLLRWSYDQLMPEVVQELKSRAPIKKIVDRPYKLRHAGAIYRKELLCDHIKGSRGSDIYRINLEIARCGIRAPIMHQPPGPNNETGIFDAPFLWWVMAYCFQAYSYGWFFSTEHTDWNDENERVRWPTFAEVRQKIVEDEDYLSRQQEAKAKGAAALLSQAMELNISKGSGKEKFNPNLYVDSFLQKFNKPIVKLDKENGGKWLVFNGKIWERLGEDAIIAMMIDAVGYGLVSNEVSSIIVHLRSKCRVEGDFPQSTDCVVFKNGTLYLDDKAQAYEWEPIFDVQDHVTRMIPHNYQPGEQCPKFINWLREIMPNPEKQKILQEWAGYCLWPGNKLHKFLITYGEGNNGKGVYTKILSKMVGESNVGTIHVSQLGSNRFALGKNNRKLLIHDSDVPITVNPRMFNPGEISEKVKKWAGADLMDVEQKHIESVSSEMDPKLMMSANAFPAWMCDNTRGFWRRVLIVGFDVTIPEEKVIVGIEEALAEELPGIIGWALEGLRRIKTVNPETGVMHNFTKCSENDHLRDQLREESDSVAAFTRYLVHIEGDAAKPYYSIKPLMDAYKEFCEDEGMTAIFSRPKFVRRLHTLGFDICQVENEEVIGENVNTKRPYGFRGFYCTWHTFNAMNLQTENLAQGTNIQFIPPTMHAGSLS